MLLLKSHPSVKIGNFKCQAYKAKSWMIVNCVSMSSTDHFHKVLTSHECKNYIHEKKKCCSKLAENTCSEKDEINFTVLLWLRAQQHSGAQNFFHFLTKPERTLIVYVTLCTFQINHDCSTFTTTYVQFV